MVLAGLGRRNGRPNPEFEEEVTLEIKYSGEPADTLFTLQKGRVSLVYPCIYGCRVSGAGADDLSCGTGRDC